MAGPTAYIDPSEARDFASDLRATINYYARAIERLESNLGRLSNTWRDRQFVEFRAEVGTLKQGLVSYIRESEEADKRLGYLATHAEDYQKLNLR